MRISDWSSDVCSSDLRVVVGLAGRRFHVQDHRLALVGGVEHVAGFGDHADRLQAEYFLDVLDRQHLDRKSVVKGTRGSVRVNIGGRRIYKKTIRMNRMQHTMQSQDTTKHLIPLHKI